MLDRENMATATYGIVMYSNSKTTGKDWFDLLLPSAKPLTHICFAIPVDNIWNHAFWYFSSNGLYLAQRFIYNSPKLILYGTNYAISRYLSSFKRSNRFLQDFTRKMARRLAKMKGANKQGRTMKATPPMHWLTRSRHIILKQLKEIQ